MGPLTDAFRLVSNALREWPPLHWWELEFEQRPEALLVIAGLVLITIAALGARRLRGQVPGRTHVALPAIPPSVNPPRRAFIRHMPFAVFAVSLPVFFIALADPYTALTRTDVTFPGRRIAILIDASLSMVARFPGTQFHRRDGTTFSTNVAAAEYFMRMRIKGRYRDLISLVEFGNEAYVITPFTNDYNNILLSIQLIGDPMEWRRFPEGGTIITKAIGQGAGLFKAYDFLNASGNLMVIFSDGQDSNVRLQGLSLDEVLAEAIKHKIPVHMIRSSYDGKLGDVLPDKLWKAAVERTGGRFYAGTSEEVIMQAIRQIDSLATGRIDVREYSVRLPRFSPYALLAAGLWTLALALQLTIRQFRTFP